MQTDNWTRIADVYAQLCDAPQEEHEALLNASGLSEEDIRSVRRLLQSRQNETGFMATGGASGTGFELLQEGEQVGNWRIQSFIGAGGMGEVYRVERADGHYEQIAALKRITASDEKAFERFERERQVLAQLEHSHIARLIDGGVDQQGAPFLVMEFVEGIPFDAYVQSQGFSAEQILRKYLKVCEAVSHAHGRFVLHRDLKPSNLMITQAGDVKLIDFGVAGLLGEVEGDLKAPKTLLYAAPEQLSGDPVSVQTDIFGLGITLAELLTGKPPLRPDPFRAPEITGLPVDLSQILQKAMAEAPGSRYSSVSALVDDIENFLTFRPVSARPSGLAYRTRLFLRRNVMATGLFTVLLAGLMGTYWQFHKAETERDVALRERERLRTMQEATFLMFSAAGSEGRETTAYSLITKAADRVRAEFDKDPEGSLPVLQLFGELLFLVNDYKAAEPLLELVAASDPNEENADIVARAAHDLANVLLRSGEADKARAALDRALTIWNEEPGRFQDQLISAALIESQLAAEAGDLPKAQDILEVSLPARLALSGEMSTDTAILLSNIGVLKMKQGDLPGAIESSERARGVFGALNKLESPDGLNVMNNLSSLYHLSGMLDEAEQSYNDALKLRRALYGPSAALAVLISNYGKLKLQKNDLPAAAELLREAVSMADEFSGPGSPPAVAARFGLIEVLAKQESPEEAQSVLEIVERNLGEDARKTGVYAGLLLLAKAEVKAATGAASEAVTHLNAADEIFTALGPSGGRFLTKSAQIRAALAVP